MTNPRTPQPETVGIEYGDKWIAWDEANLKIIGSGNSYEEAKEAGQATGTPDPIIEYIPPTDGAFIGGQ